MSRICVKNLPKYVAEDRLRDFFSQKGEVTDAKIMRTKDGKSRQFAFIGFRTEEEADEAIKFFNNVYMDTCRITCEGARKVGDPNIPRPWSRHSVKREGSSTEGNRNITGAESSSLLDSKGEGVLHVKGNKSKLSVSNNDPQLQEFLQVMQPRSKSKLWANDTLEAIHADGSGKIVGNETDKRKGNKNQLAHGSSDKENEFVLQSSSSPQQNGLSETSAMKLLHDLDRGEMISDMDYFKSRVKKDWSDSEDDDEDLHNENQTGQEDQMLDAREASATLAGDLPDKTEGNSLSEDPDCEKVDNGNSSSGLRDEEREALETNRLFVRNLPYTASEDDLMELFSKFGDVSQVHLVVDKETRRSKGFAYVLYVLPGSAIRALEELDRSSFQGRLLHVMPAKQQHSSAKLESSPAKGVAKSLKQQREDQRKASEASGDTRAWNSLFMNPDTVVENIALQYGVSKSDLLDKEADDLAVRIALGETSVIAETKKALVNAGVNIGALEELASGKKGDVKRSDNVILVKNLPYGSSEGDLVKMFGKFGSLDKIILPHTKTLALVIFLEAGEARAAFKGLAYKRYKDRPLYLERAPSNILSSSTSLKTEAQNNAVGEKDVKRVLIEQCVEGISGEDIDPDRVESRSLFVKNLNFKTTEDVLRKHFSENIKAGKIHNVKIKQHLKNGKNVSMGFGFIEFDSMETATSVCRDLQGSVLEGHALILQLCHSKDGKALEKVEKDKSTTKLIVRNVAFQATKKDLRQLFSSFGQIKSLRLPMKFGNHRGFAFVEYVTKQEAQNALQALSSTHLYGRHLVLERAKEGESLEELRARTAAQFMDEERELQNMQKVSKKRKFISTVNKEDI
ncbi:RNA recognition motif domain-containing protein [Cinnamomum micranthum f. kanehirae]|uniref:RNA recognition motif domain-containing protein n=1 Tax=Cinnamomum micranthum f. kanehirae TaxID=337451 RepID=A0A3S3PE30_9MAGN|nr:RNA recognition motif domain-containing protein [Cinnamomum micranthum f. kanehirae]